jgi:hypothetical protein
MNKVFKSLPSFLVLLLLAISCAKAPIEKARKRKRSYDQGVEDEFSKIENDQRDVLDYYRRLRSQNWENYKNKYNRPVPRRRAPKPAPIKRVYKPKSYPVQEPEPTPEPERISLPDDQIEEMKIEARQHMDYFCMEKRKSKRFSDTADCLAFTEDTYRNCMVKFPVLYDRSLVKCIRSKLH